MAVLRTRRRRGAATAILCAIVAAAVLVAGVETSASSAGSPSHRADWEIAAARNDGLGITPGTIKHVWLIILENKSYDAIVHGPQQQHVPVADAAVAGGAAEELLRHRPLQPGQLHLAGQRSGDAAGHAGRLPVLRRVLREDRHVRIAATNPDYGQVVSAAGTNAAAGSNGCVYAPDIKTLFNQLDAAGVSWKGYAQDLGNADASGPAHSAGVAGLRRAVRDAGSDREHGAAEPGERECDGSVRPQALPVPVVRVDPLEPQGLQRGAYRQSVRPEQRPLPRPAERVDDTGVQLDLAEQLQRRARRGLPREQPLRRLLRPQHPEGAAQQHRRALRRRPLPRARRARDRGLAGVQGRRPDRRHVRRGVPAVHLQRQQLRQLDDRSARRGHFDRIGLGRRDAVGPDRSQRADRPEHAAGDRRRAATSSTRAPATTRSSTGRATASPRRSRRSLPGRVCSAAARPSRAHAPTRRRPRPPPVRRSSTTRPWRPTWVAA